MLENEHLTSNMLTSGLKLGCKRDLCLMLNKFVQWKLSEVSDEYIDDTKIRVKLENNYALMRHIKLFLYKLILWTKLLLPSPLFISCH